MRDITRGPIVGLVTEITRGFLYLNAKVRRRDVTEFICGKGPEHSKKRSALRPCVTNSLDDLVAQSYAAPGRITRVSFAKTGSGEIKFWTLTGRPPKWTKEQHQAEFRRLHQLVVDSDEQLKNFFRLKGCNK